MIENPTMHTITVPIGLGGKTTPYITDPAPTLVLELPSSETTREEGRIAELRSVAEAEAQALRAEADADAHARREAAEREASELIQNAVADADARTAAAEARVREIDERLEALEPREMSLTEGEAQLTARLAAVDAEASESAALLAAARDDAESIVAEAQATAEGIIDEARRQAGEDADAVIAAAASDATADFDSRLEEIESVHRIEIRVLREHEQELLERVTALEAARRVTTVPAATDSNDNGGSDGRDEFATSIGNAQTAVAVATDGRAHDSKAGGRHATDTRSFEREPPPIATHVTLTEQLSTNAFRITADKDRRGRRRR
jgi:F0F1-type ATP synthase membrane subunit b/b'